MKKSRRVFLFFLIMLIATFFAFPRISFASQEEVTFGNDKNYAPYSFVENGLVKGYETELINLIFSDNRYVLNFEMDYSWAEVLNLTKNGDLDLCGPLIVTPKYKQEMLISDVAYSRYYGVFSNVSSGKLKFSDLKQLKIGAVRGYYGQVIANDLIKAEEIVLFDNYAEMLQALAENQIIASVDAIEGMKYYIREEGLGDKIILQEDGMFSYDASFGISKDSPDLLNYINKRLKEIKASGEYEILYIKNFSTHSKDYIDVKNRTNFLSIIVVIAIALLLILLLRLYIQFLRKKITEDQNKLNEKDKQLIYLSRFDRLTGLYDRKFYEDEILKLNTRENLPLSLIMGDVNGLKLINDSFGHEIGDKILITAANAIKQNCGPDDIAARLGGDEFVIALPKSSTNDALELTEKIKKQLKLERVNGIEISLSFGCDTKLNEQQSFNGVFKKTEDQMNRHKIYESASIRRETINLITSALFAKSTRELAHSSKVSQLCIQLSKEMGFSKENVDKMRLAGLMHDIGKIGISDKILNKKGKLTAEEYSEIKKHPAIGYRILSAVNEFSEIADYVLEHQEKWDGSGYPQGLKGDQIRIEARIIAIVDAYDAMTSKRTYGIPVSHKEAMDEIRLCKGTHFDPVIAEVFVEMMIDNPTL